MYDVRKYVHDFFLCLGHMNVFLSSPYYMGVAPKITSVSQLCTTLEGRTPGQILHGQWYFSCLATFAPPSSHSQSLMFWACICLTFPNGNHLALWASMCNFVPFTCYFCNMPLHPWSKFPTKFTKYTWSNLHACLSNTVTCPSTL
jgi:hypothetical protein